MSIKKPKRRREKRPRGAVEACVCRKRWPGRTGICAECRKRIHDRSRVRSPIVKTYNQFRHIREDLDGPDANLASSLDPGRAFTLLLPPGHPQ